LSVIYYCPLIYFC